MLLNNIRGNSAQLMGDYFTVFVKIQIGYTVNVKPVGNIRAVVHIDLNDIDKRKFIVKLFQNLRGHFARNTGLAEKVNKDRSF